MDFAHPMQEEEEKEESKKKRIQNIHLFIWVSCCS